MKVLLICFFICLSCNENKSPQNRLNNANYTAIVTNYLNIQKALAFDDNSNIYSIIISTRNAISNLNNQNVVNWSTISADLKNALEQYQVDSTIQQNRENFQLLSRSVIKLIQEYGYESDIFIMKCPMAFNNKGATWLQSNKDLINPYFGAEMFKCGNVLKQLNFAEKTEQN